MNGSCSLLLLTSAHPSALWPVGGTEEKTRIQAQGLGFRLFTCTVLELPASVAPHPHTPIGIAVGNRVRNRVRIERCQERILYARDRRAGVRVALQHILRLFTASACAQSLAHRVTAIAGVVVHLCGTGWGSVSSPGTDGASAVPCSRRAHEPPSLDTVQPEGLAPSRV